MNQLASFAILCFASVGSLSFGWAGAPGSQEAQQEAQPDPVWLWADVELMGHRSVDREAILAEVDLPLGEPYQTDFEAWRQLEDHLEETFEFAEVRVSAVRFVGFQAYLTVDVVEQGDEHRLEYRDAPTGQRPVADEAVAKLFERLSELRSLGFERGQPAPEKAGEGFLDFDHPELHELALQLREAVPAHRAGLIEVLAHDADAEDRARAATLLNWAGDVADSIAQVHVFADDPSSSVRNNVTRFLLHYLDRVESAEVRQALIAQLARQLRRPSHTDRNKAVYGLLHLVESWPADLPRVGALAGETLQALAQESILFNVRDPAQQLLELIEAAKE